MILGTEVEVADLERHYLDDTIVQITKEPGDPELSTEHMTAKTMKKRWGAMLYP
jgi:hypothetical protein